jgi:hypothetical protein
MKGDQNAMTKREAQQKYQEIRSQYNKIRSPKYLNVDLQDFKCKYKALLQLKEHLESDVLYVRLLNGMSQIISRATVKSTRLNLTERGMNKSLVPITKKTSAEIDLPHQWTGKEGRVCLINGYWGVKNYMLMDAISFFFLLKEGGDSLPDRLPPLFAGLEGIRQRESDLSRNSSEKRMTMKQPISDEKELSELQAAKYSLRFNDSDFRKFTSMKMSSTKILELVHATSQVEFKIVFPVRLNDDKDRYKEKWFPMNFFSRLFEFGYRDKQVRKDGIVQSRNYLIAFNTILGELFVNNLKTHNFDWLPSSFYHLPPTAQLLYRRFLIHHNFPTAYLNLTTITEALNLRDKNSTNLLATIEVNALQPLRTLGLITSYEKTTDGLYGTKYVIKKPTKKELIASVKSAHDASSLIQDGGFVKE